MKKLNQVLTVEKNVKGRHHAEISELYKIVQKPALFAGFSKIYEKKMEDSDDLPPESQRVQHNVTDVLGALTRRSIELLDVTATKDFTNCYAKADVVVDDKVLIKDVPPTFLLFLEKQLVDLRTFVDSLPELDPSETWTFDNNANVFKTGAVKSSRTKKVQKPIVLYQATAEHPAQTQLITEDVQAGTWTTVKHSGAVPRAKKEKMLSRVESLLKAVKCAREEANISPATDTSAGKIVFDYILGE